MASSDELARAVDASEGKDPQVLILWADAMDEERDARAEFIRWCAAEGKRPRWNDEDDGVPWTGWDWYCDMNDTGVLSDAPEHCLSLRAWDDRGVKTVLRSWYGTHFINPVDAYLAAAREWLKPEYSHLRAVGAR